MNAPLRLLLVSSTVLLTAKTALASHGDPYRPIGHLDASRSFVRAGDQTELAWSISYPINTSDLVVINADGQLIAVEDLVLSVRVAGTDVDHTGAVWISLDRGGWQQIFVGGNNDVDPTKAIFEQLVPAGTSIDLGGRARDSSGIWQDARTTIAGDTAIVVLENEQAAPDEFFTFDSGSVEPYLTAFFNTNNGHGNNVDGVDMSNPGESTGTSGSTETDATVDDEMKMQTVLGPSELLYLFELDSRDSLSLDYTLQDLALVVSVQAP